MEKRYGIEKKNHLKKNKKKIKQQREKTSFQIKGFLFQTPKRGIEIMEGGCCG